MSLALSFLLMTALWSCKKDKTVDTGVKVADIVVNISVPSEGVFATSATVKMQTQSAVTYAWKVVEGSGDSMIDGAVIYSEAKERVDGVMEIQGGETEFQVNALEANKTYTVFVAFEATDGYKVEKVTFTTKEYTDKLTFIEAGMFKIKFHVEMPEDKYYKVVLLSTEVYETNKFTNGEDYSDINYMADGDFSLGVGGMPLPQFKGSQTITFENGVSIYKGAYNEEKVLNWSENGSDPVEEADLVTQINPGTSYELLIFECKENGDFYDYFSYGEGGIMPMSSRSVNPNSPLAPSAPNLKEYSEEAPSDPMFGEFTGMFMHQRLFTQAPAKGTGSVNVEQTVSTEKTIAFRITPSDDIYKIKYQLIEQGEHYEQLLKYVGGEEGIEAMIFGGGYEANGAEEVAFDAELGKKYNLYVSAIYNEDATIRDLFKFEGLTATESKDPACELEITNLNLNSPWCIGFNVKAPNKDCAAFRYLLNYTNEWWPMINTQDGEDRDAKIIQLIGQYGATINVENGFEILNQVNSPEGYNMYFNSQDDKESWLVVLSYNSGEKTKLFADGVGNRATSAVWEAEEPVESDLFSTLCGEWQGSFTRIGSTKPVTFDVTIGKDLPGCTETLQEDDENTLIEYYKKQGETAESAKALVDEYWQDYKTSQNKFKDKYKNHNMLVATGFLYDTFLPEFASPYDLFTNTGYSSYDTDEMFHDYGPKLFFRINADQSITLVSSKMDENDEYYEYYIEPFEGWKRHIQLFGYNSTYATEYDQYDFPVTLSDDGNTLTIGAAQVGILDFTPAFAQEVNSGVFSWNAKVDEQGIILTRKTDSTPETTSIKSRAVNTVNANVSPVKSHNYLRRTRLPKKNTLPEIVKRVPFSVEKYFFQ